MEDGQENIKTVAIDHLGLVAAVCKDLKIAERIDNRLSIDPQRKVSPGTAVVAMILNGLGFTNRRLYLTHQFFESKPIEKLLGEELYASDITDYTLGHTLDDISEYGASKLFAEVAFGVAVENNLLGSCNHLDSTSFSVHGEYEINDDPKIIEIKHGHSKDHRPDLKQAILSLVVNGPSSIPLWMDPLNGNSSDKTSFHETVKKVREFQKQIDLESDCKWIADSALYTKDKLLKSNEYLWLTRVPEVIKEAKELVERPEKEIEWMTREKGYKTASFPSFYGGVEQRWLLVFSEQAYHREKKTLEKNLKKKKEELEKKLWHFSKQIFHCENDGIKELKKIKKSYPLYKIDEKVVVVSKHKKAGKPKQGMEKSPIGYRIEALIEENEEEKEKLLTKKGRFILATNDLDKEEFKDEKMLEEYKEQQKVEGGFKFLKDPWFMVDSIFLKLPKRIESLMMVMTLCLMIYNIGQYKVRIKLKEKGETLPNQLGKEVDNPTMRWIFQMMEGISIVRFFGEVAVLTREVIANLTDLRKKIIYLFGHTAMQIYGLN